VFVCDGFVGNLLLKFGEGLAAAVLKLIKNEVRKHPLAIFGKYLLKGAFKELLKRTDPAEYGGAPLLGVNGVALVSTAVPTPRPSRTRFAAPALSWRPRSTVRFPIASKKPTPIWSSAAPAVPVA
jgi:hypothetical protein